MDLYQKNIYNRIERFVPEAAVAEVYKLWERYPFRFVVSKSRNSKLGDFRKKPNEELAIITVNENLNSYNFLLTLIHEIAHHWVYKKYKNRVSPHGTEWKRQFQELLNPFLRPQIFPDDLLISLRKHMINPKASSQSDIHLAKLLSAYDEGKSRGVALDTLTIGSEFELEKRVFKSIESRRTRVRCKEKSTGKNYLVHKLAVVQPIIQDKDS